MNGEPLVLTDCTVFPGPRSMRPASAVAMAEGQVIATGGPALAAGGRRIPLGGRVVVPGLIDAHCHLTAAASRRLTLDLGQCSSISEVLRELRAWAAATPEGQWIRGWGWDHYRWHPSVLPTRHDLDRAMPHRPVWLSRRDGHSACLNTRAMDLLGVPLSAPEDLLPRGADGTPVGIVRETLRDELVLRLPQHPTEVHVGALLEEQQHLFSQGIVGVHTVERSRGMDVLESAVRGGGLLCRLYVMAEAMPPESSIWDGRVVNPQGSKLFVDGSLGSGTAWLLNEDRHTASGTTVTVGTDLAAGVEAALRAGLDPCIHAIGDKAVREVLDVFEPLLASYPERAFRIEHAQHFDRSDGRRLARSNLFLSVQPCHLLSDRTIISRLPRYPDRLDFAFGFMHSQGATLLMGTDFPIEPADPWRNMAAAMDRCDAGEEPWHPDQRLDWPTILHGYSVEPARVAGWSAAGSLVAGNVADLVVVERDPSQGAPWGQHVCVTMLNGRVVYSDGCIDLQ